MIQLELVNVFISSTALILKGFGVTLRKEKLAVDQVPKTTHEVNIVFGINGVVSSTIVMGMSSRTAKKLATLVLRGPIYDQTFAGNAITMLGADICSTIVGNMNQVGIDVFGRQATLINGMGVSLSTLNGRKILVTFDTEVGQIDLRITIE